jgi:UDP-2,3-diacylglucosamine pyrophosphatase LpxH
MTSTSRVAELIVLSDLHLGEGRSADPSRYSPMEDFFYDDAFARLLEHLQHENRDDPSCVKLVLNGDVFDFLTVTRVPGDEQAAAFGFKMTAAEKRFGMNPTPRKSVYKLDQIVAGHPVFFAALARFIAAGHEVEILRGNHDLELYFDVVRNRLTEHLTRFAGGPTRAQIAERLRFHQWFYLEEGRVYIEHGNQYEASNSIRYPLRPLLPARRARKEPEEMLDYPLGSMFVRYFYNSIHRLEPHTPKVISFEQYLEFLRRHNLLDLLRIARSHYPFFMRAIGRAPPAGTSGPSREGDAAQAEAFEELERQSAEHDFHRELAALKIHPLAASKAALAEQMARPVIRRAAWTAGVATASAYIWLLIFNLIQAPWLVESVFLKAVFLGLLTLGSMVGLFWLGGVLGRRLRLRTDETVELCAERAGHIARTTGVKLVLMGHTHVVDIRTVNDGDATYANSGTWTTVDNPWDRLHPDARRFTLLRVRDDTVSVCRWNDDAGRIEPVPMFDLPEDRGLTITALAPIPSKKPPATR